MLAESVTVVSIPASRSTPIEQGPSLIKLSLNLEMSLEKSDTWSCVIWIKQVVQKVSFSCFSNQANKQQKSKITLTRSSFKLRENIVV